MLIAQGKHGEFCPGWSVVFCFASLDNFFCENNYFKQFFNWKEITDEHSFIISLAKAKL